MFNKIKICDDFALRENECRISLEKIIVSNKAYLKKKIIENIIHGLKCNEPAGLVHIIILSKILRRPIKIWQNNDLTHVFGKSNGKIPLNAVFKNQTDRKLNIGHWSLKNGNNPLTKGATNECLYSVISSQTGINPSDLKFKIARYIRKNESISELIMNSVNPAKIMDCMVGGARYTGTSPRDAKLVLDRSQNGSAHPDGRSGHPRGHASHSSGGGSTDSIESYSMSRWRSGFLSRSDQDLVAHYTLITNSARNLMESLNRGQYKVDSHISRNDLDYDPLPKAQIWSEGVRKGNPEDFRTVCLVGKHFMGQANNPNEDIFILTFYPIL